jgi:glucokinase
LALTIGVDIGGTKVAAGVVDDNGTILQDVRRDTPSTQVDEIADVIADVVAELRANHDVVAVGVGAAGFVDANRSEILFAPNLAWRNEPLRDDVGKRVGLPVVVENDANAAAWAEVRFGAGRGVRDAVMVTIGTGIGGGIVLDGRLFRGEFGVAAEMGHMQVVPHGRHCGCGQRGCWEQYGSGRALVREAREIAGTDSGRAETLLALGDGTADSITGLHVTEAAKNGDPVALEAFDVVGRWIGVGLTNLVSVMDPIRSGFQMRLPGSAYRPIADIRLAELGNDAGLVGAADLARPAT